MKIAIIYLGRQGSGAAISLLTARHLSDSAKIFSVICSHAENVAEWRASQIPLIETETYQTPIQAITSSLNPGSYRSLLHRIRQENPDVLYFPMLHTWTPILLRGLRDIPSVVTVHDPYPHPGFANRVLWQLDWVSMHWATRCVVLSKQFVSTLQRLGIPSSQIDVIPHGELSYYRSISRGSSARSSVPTILFFGRITSYKGLDVLLDAFVDIERRTNARLLIVGAGNLDPYAAQLSRLTRVEVINRWVKDEEIDGFFSQATMVVLPYTSATQSGVAAVASGLGIPIVSSRVGGIAEQIAHEETGLLVEPGAPADLADACIRLLADPILATHLAQAARIQAHHDFGWPTIARQIMQSCQQAADSIPAT
jgi:glycosyltransferase involved in cell wall biosynthesis